MRRVFLGLATAAAGMSMFLKVLLGVAVHFYTVFIAYTISGGFAAFLTLIFPGISEMFWVASIYLHTGMFWNYLTMACAAYLATVVALIFSISMVAAASD
ncbi:MAG: hypothetical protein ABSC06_32040 [Rhodopila sp.]|jgi:hypothetical protein